jgi:hypothetical protein
MSERARRLGGPISLLVLLAIAVALRIDPGGLQVADPDDSTTERLISTLAALPDDALVLVGFDPDIGTFAEVRPTVRTLLADLVTRNARIAVVSLTPEGRALALGEMARLEREGADPRQLIDLGFVPGAEAALVDLARAIEGTRAWSAPDGDIELAGLDLVAVIGGNDLGPRSWVEQVAPRVASVPMVAVTPSVLLPEVEPYRASGQLAALISTPRQGATYRDSVDLGAQGSLGDTTGPAPLAILVGLLVAVAFLGAAVGGRLLGELRAARGTERA